MPTLLWYASALAKRYAPELGSDTVEALWNAVPRSDMAITYLGYAEICSILLRRHNGGELTTPTYNAARLMHPRLKKLESVVGRRNRAGTYGSCPIVELWCSFDESMWHVYTDCVFAAGFVPLPRWRAFS